MRGVLLLALFVCFLGGSSIPMNHCDPDYECQFTYVAPNGAVWEYDLSGLCRGNDYTATDSQNHTYLFNVCGLAHQRCLPTWKDTYQYGVAVQTWGPTPVCNDTEPKCLDPETGNYTCCTASCEVLGVGIPVWTLMDPTNPLFGGLQITHRGVPPAAEDSYKCPLNPKTHQMYERTVTYNISCDESVPPGTVNVIGAFQDTINPCAYTISMKAAAACGCSPDCDNKNCGPDGCGGFCGGLSGGCPNPKQYHCTAAQICCKPDCTFRDCGPDGCGGSCGNCSAGYECNRVQQCSQLVIPSSSNTPTPTQHASKSPFPSPIPVQLYKTKRSSIVGAFFGGLFSTFAVGGLIMYLLNKRGSGGNYVTQSLAGEAR